MGPGSGGFGNLPPTQYTALFQATNGKLNPGATASGLAFGISATFTVVDLRTVPAIPVSAKVGDRRLTQRLTT